MGLARRLVALGAAAGAAAVAATLARPALERALHRFRTSSSPSITLYESLAGVFLGGYYDDVARECAAALEGVTAPLVLEVGPGPGHLAERLVRRIPGLRLTAIDIDPQMLEAAHRRLGGALPAGEERARFIEGDVAHMPFADGAFDLVVSSFSAHHWPDAETGFREIRRVLRPGARALVYDLPATWGHVETGSSGISAAGAVFADAEVGTFRGMGPLAVVRRAVLTAPPLEPALA